MPFGSTQLGCWTSLASLPSGDSQDKKRSIFRKIRPDCTRRRDKLQSPSDKEKIERLRHEKINADSYTKRTAGRVAATPALQNTPVGLASCTTQPYARRPLEYPHLAVARAYGTDARTPFAPSFRRNRPAPHLNFLPRANCHVSSDPHVHRTSATDSRRSADPTSRMD